MRKAYSYIRMSTDTQLKGDSLRRQLEASENYAKIHDLALVDSINGIPFKDIGVSAFKGKNTQKGVLAIFLNELEKGNIETNSVLLVESLDRLSRDRVSEALTQFMTIINYGIEIVTIADNQRYTKEIINQNAVALYISLGVMLRANEESETKSKRLKAAWENKRNNVGQKVLTRLCPAWLKYSELTNQFELIEDRANIVKRIFDLCIHTCGLYGITKVLNQENIPVFGKAQFWQRSYVHKILTNRAVIGEFQSHKYLDNKAVASGEPNKHYFPAVIDENTYLSAQAAIVRRNKGDRGRKGQSFSNIFSGIVYCGNCGSRMVLRNTGAPPKGGKYLICSNRLMGAGCKSHEWKMNIVEKYVFQHLKEIDFGEIFNKEPSADNNLVQNISALEMKLADKQKEIDRALDLAIGDELSKESKDRLISKMNDLENDIKAIKQNIADSNINLIEERAARNIENVIELRNLIDLIHEKNDDYYFRSSINQLMARSIEKIILMNELTRLEPWEFEYDDMQVKSFRKLNPELAQLSLDELVSRKNFMEHAKLFHQVISIQYKVGVTRNILVGSDISLALTKNGPKLISNK